MRGVMLWLLAVSTLVLIMLVAFAAIAFLSLCRPWVVLLVVFVGLVVFLRYTVAEYMDEKIREWIDERI